MELSQKVELLRDLLGCVGDIPCGTWIPRWI